MAKQLSATNKQTKKKANKKKQIKTKLERKLNSKSMREINKGRERRESLKGKK